MSLCFFDISGLEYVELAAGCRQATLIAWEEPSGYAAALLLHAKCGGISLAGSRPLRVTGGDDAVCGGPALALACRLPDAMAAGVTASAELSTLE